MSLLNNPHWIGFDGTPITGKVPTRAIVTTDTPGLVMNGQQHAGVNHAYKLFCDAVQVSANPDGFHVQHRTLPDGTTIRMESNQGQHRVFVKISGGGSSGFELLPMGRLQPVQSSFGAASISRWVDPPIGPSWFPPAGPRKSPNWIKDFRSLWNPSTAGELNYPGNWDWSSRLDSSGLRGYVLTWWGISHARYRTLGDTKYGFTQTVFPAQTGTERALTIWCNGFPVVKIPPAPGRELWTACLHKKPSGEVVVRAITKRLMPGISDLRKFEGWEIPFFRRGFSFKLYVPPAGTVISPSWEVDLSSGMYPGACNSSGTKAVMYNTLPQFTPAAPSHLLEIDLANGVTNTVPITGFTSPAENTRTVTNGGVVHWTVPVNSDSSGSYDFAFSGSHSYGYTTVTESKTLVSALLGADYKGDELVYVTARKTKGTRTEVVFVRDVSLDYSVDYDRTQTTLLEDVSGVGARGSTTHESTITTTTLSAGADIWHSSLGTVWSLERERQRVETQATDSQSQQDETYEYHKVIQYPSGPLESLAEIRTRGTDYEGTYTRTRSEGPTSVDVPKVAVYGDLRVDSMDIAYSLVWAEVGAEVYSTTSSGSGVVTDENYLGSAAGTSGTSGAVNTTQTVSDTGYTTLNRTYEAVARVVAGAVVENPSAEVMVNQVGGTSIPPSSSSVSSTNNNPYLPMVTGGWSTSIATVGTSFTDYDNSNMAVSTTELDQNAVFNQLGCVTYTSCPAGAALVRSIYRPSGVTGTGNGTNASDLVTLSDREVFPILYPTDGGENVPAIFSGGVLLGPVAATGRPQFSHPVIAYGPKEQP